MIRYVVSRLVVSVAMVLLATLVIFLIANTVPGDPVLTALGDMAASDPAQVAEFRARWGLDLPLHHQLIVWAMSDKVTIPIFANDSPNFKYSKMK